MNKPAVSIIMTTYNRAPLLRNTLESFRKQSFTDYEVVVVDDGNDEETPQLVAETWPFPVKYHRLNREKYKGYNNPARPNNVGIRMAEGDTIILQNAECMHSGNEVILKLAAACGDNDCVFAQVFAADQTGGGNMWYCHKTFSPRPFFFCGALRKAWFDKLRGFDEDYTYYGMDDVDFADRLDKSGVKFVFSDIDVTHQWHPYSYDAGDGHNNIPILLHAQKTRDMAAGIIGVERNLGRDWGQP